MDLHTSPEPCQQAVTDVLDRLEAKAHALHQHANGCVPISDVLRLIRSSR